MYKPVRIITTGIIARPSFVALVSPFFGGGGVAAGAGVGVEVFESSDGMAGWTVSKTRLVGVGRPSFCVSDEEGSARRCMWCVGLILSLLDGTL